MNKEKTKQKWVNIRVTQDIRNKLMILKGQLSYVLYEDVLNYLLEKK
jgi:hypothetical protein